MSCIFQYFLRGKTHDLYALIAVFVLNAVLYFEPHLYRFVAIADLVLATGVFVDLWAHCFHH